MFAVERKFGAGTELYNGNREAKRVSGGDDVELLKHCEELGRLAERMRQASEELDWRSAAGELSIDAIASVDNHVRTLSGLWQRTVRSIVASKAAGEPGLLAKKGASDVCLHVESSCGVGFQHLALSVLDDCERLRLESASFD